jgi:phosphoglycolate phosphatase
MKHHLVVWDWNGTVLADTIPSWKASNVMLEFHGVAPISYQKFRQTFHFPVIHFYKLNGCDVDDVLARREESNTLFQSTYESLSTNVRTRRGVREILHWLEDIGVTCMILSNYRTKKIRAKLDTLGLSRFFPHISANNDDGTSILTATSKLERLSLFITQHGFKPANTFIIGDSAEEPDVARHLGLTSIGITGGIISEDRLRHARPDHIVHNISHVKKIFEERWANART